MSIVKLQFVLAPMLWLAASGSTLAQGHNDITFRYGDYQVVVDGGTLSGVFAARFDTAGIFQQYASNPGFASEADTGGGLQVGDVVVYHVLDNLRVWAAGAFAEPADGMRIRIENNLPDVPDTLVTATSGEQLGSNTSPMRNVIGGADGVGDFHSHIDFLLEPNPFPEPLPSATHGAYGLKLSLATSREGIAPSDPFWVAFNFGLSEGQFAEAVAAYRQLLEPTLAGDYNADGVVDAADYLVWRNSLGSTTNLAANGDNTGASQGVIDAADYLVWKAGWGETRFGGAFLEAATRPVPEPRWLGAALVGMVLWSVRRMR